MVRHHFKCDMERASSQQDAESAKRWTIMSSHVSHTKGWKSYAN